MFHASFDHPFGNYALALYARPDVAQRCLQWQDELGVDINLLLWATWLDSQGLAFVESYWLVGSTKVQRLRERVIKPLRAIRRLLKPVPVLYTSLKRIELWAESIAMARLYRHSQANSQSVLKTDKDRVEGGSYCQYYLDLFGVGCKTEDWKELVGLKES